MGIWIFQCDHCKKVYTVGLADNVKCPSCGAASLENGSEEHQTLVIRIDGQ